MKRMANAFAMRQTIGILERSETPTAALTRWTVLEQRFPSLADLLIEHPEWTSSLVKQDLDEKERQKLPASLAPFLASDAVARVIGHADGDKLTAEHVKAITRGSAT